MIRTTKLTLLFLQSFITNALPKLSLRTKGPKHTQNTVVLSHSETCKKKATIESNESMKEMDLEAVGDLILHKILSNLTPKDTAIAACVSNKLKSSASEDILWSKFCSQELDLNEPIDPLGNLTPSFMACYQAWREAFSMYPWPLVMRVKRCWGRLKNWLSINFPEAEATLRKGVSEVEIQESERILKVKLPLPTRILYRFCDGQEFKAEKSSGSAGGSLLGLIGGYSFYTCLVNVFLLPLNKAVLKTKAIIQQIGLSSRSKYIVVAASSTESKKFFFLDCTTGQLYVGTVNLETEGEMIPCVPNALLSSVHDPNGDQQQDAMLLWLEEHARRLENGMIKLREKGGSRSISLFPEEPPLCSTAITNGVKVRASAVFVPEIADLQNENAKYTFSYSIRMSLQHEGCVINGIPFSSCQLKWRHWIIRANDCVESDFNGEAVIGKYPLLLPGEKEFVYESCTPLPTSLGSVEGSFTFVPGRLVDPKGAPFEVEVARFPLQLPDYIF